MLRPMTLEPAAPAAGEDPLLATSPRAYRLGLAALALAVLPAAAALLGLGCGRQDAYPWDAAFLLDGGWRLYCGQRPHTDFYSPLGAVPLLLTAAGMWLRGPSAQALATGYVLLCPAVAAWAWALARPRFPAALALLFAAQAAFLLAATRPLDFPFGFGSYAMQYNRLGWALAALLLLPLLVPPRAPNSPRRDGLEGVSSGVLLGLLAFTKVNFLALGLLAVVTGWWLFGLSRQRAAGLALGGLAVMLALLSYLRFDLHALTGDLRLLTAVQRPADRLAALVSVVDFNRLWLGLLAVTAVVLSRRLPGETSGRGPAAWWRWLAAALVVAGLSIMVCSTNMQQQDMSLLALAALVLAEGFRRRLVAQTGKSRQVYASAGALMAVLFICTALVPDVASIIASLSSRLSGADGNAARFDAGPLRDMPLPPQPGEHYADREALHQAILRHPSDQFLTSCQYAGWVDDGLQLVRRHMKPDSRVFALEWSNLYPFALGLPSPRGPALWWHFDRVLDEHHCPSAERVFADVTLVLVPRHDPPGDIVQRLRGVYGATLAAEFEPVDESLLWTLHARRPARGGDN